MDAPELDTLGMLAAVILLLVREYISPKSSDTPGIVTMLKDEISGLKSHLAELQSAADRMERMHNDSDSKFSTVRVMRVLEHDLMKAIIGLEAQAARHTARLTALIERSMR